MKSKKIKLIIIISIFSALLIVVARNDNSEKYKLETIQVEGGYGYLVKKAGKTLIYQPVIPAIGKEKPFTTEDDAFRTGSLVLERIRQGKDFSITVTELRELNIE